MTDYINNQTKKLKKCSRNKNTDRMQSFQVISLLFFFIFSTLNSCRTPGLKNVTGFYDGAHDKNIVPAIPAPEKIDEIVLVTEWVKAVPKVFGDATVAAVSVGKDPRADFVQYSFCLKNDPSKCSPGTDQPNKFVFNPEYYPKVIPGENIVKARSCVRESRATTPEKQCSAWVSNTYLQPDKPRADVATKETGPDRTETSEKNDAPPTTQEVLAEEFDTKQDIVKTCDEIHKELLVYQEAQKVLLVSENPSVQVEPDQVDIEKRNLDQLISNLINIGSDLNCEMIMSDRFDDMVSNHRNWLPWILIGLGSASIISSVFLIKKGKIEVLNRPDQFRANKFDKAAPVPLELSSIREKISTYLKEVNQAEIIFEEQKVDPELIAKKSILTERRNYLSGVISSSPDEIISTKMVKQTVSDTETRIREIEDEITIIKNQRQAADDEIRALKKESVSWQRQILEKTEKIKAIEGNTFETLNAKNLELDLLRGEILLRNENITVAELQKKDLSDLKIFLEQIAAKLEPKKAISGAINESVSPEINEKLKKYFVDAVISLSKKEKGLNLIVDRRGKINYRNIKKEIEALEGGVVYSNWFNQFRANLQIDQETFMEKYSAVNNRLKLVTQSAQSQVPIAQLEKEIFTLQLEISTLRDTSSQNVVALRKQIDELVKNRATNHRMIEGMQKVAKRDIDKMRVLREQVESIKKMRDVLTPQMVSEPNLEKQRLALELKQVNVELEKVEFSIKEQEAKILKAETEYNRLTKVYEQDLVRLDSERMEELAKLNKDRSDDFLRVKKEFEDLEAKRFQKYSEDMKRYFENFSPNKKGVDDIEFQKYIKNQRPSKYFDQKYDQIKIQTPGMTMKRKLAMGSMIVAGAGLIIAGVSMLEFSLAQNPKERLFSSVSQSSLAIDGLKKYLSDVRKLKTAIYLNSAFEDNSTP